MGESSPNSDLYFLEFVCFINVFCFVFFCDMLKKIGQGGAVGCLLANSSFSQIFGFFLPDKTPYYEVHFFKRDLHRARRVSDRQL